MIDLLELPEWHLDAACRGMDTDLFFPYRGESLKKAKAICTQCPVQEECLTWAIEENEKFGIWGGLNERNRRRVKKERAA